MRKKVLIGLVAASALAVPASAGANPGGVPNGNSVSCAESSNNSAQNKQVRADQFFGGSIGELQKAHCGPEFSPQP